MADDPPFKMPELKSCAFTWKPAPSARYDFSHMITIIVGPEEKEFIIPEGVLTWHSSYFAGALKGGFRECQDRKITLDDEEVKVFERFQYWLFIGRFDDPTPADDGEGTPEISQLMCCKLYVFGDKRGIPALQNDAIDKLHEVFTTQWCTFPHSVHYTYNNTVEGSGLRKYLVNVYHGLKDFATFRKGSPEKYTADFLLDLMAKVEASGGWKVFAGQQDWAMIDRCQYHDHTEPEGAKGRKRKAGEME